MNLYVATKKESKRVLRNNWGKAIAIFGITAGTFFLISALEDLVRTFLGLPVMDDGSTVLKIKWSTSALSVSVTVIAFLFELIALSPLKIGSATWYYRTAGEIQESVGTIFDWFSGARLFFRSVWLAVNMFVRKALWAALLVLPGSALIFYAVKYIRFKSGDNTFFVLFIIFGILAALIGFFFWAWIVQRYFLAYYIIADSRETGVMSAFKYSVKAMSGFTFKAFMLKLSFIGWFIFSVLAIPALYAVPYYNQSCACLGRYILTLHKSENSIPQ